MSAFSFPVFSAHRGGGFYAPENTLDAFKTATRYGFQAAECDVKLSADQIPILLHDDTLWRTGGMHLTAAQSDATLLVTSRVNAGYDHFDSCVPLLSTVVDYCRSCSMALNLEIKPSPGTDEKTAKVVAATALNLWQGSSVPFMFSSFSTTSLKVLRDDFPQVRRAWLTEGRLGEEEIMATLRDLSCFALNVADEWLTFERIARIKNSGYAIFAWTVNDMSRAAQLLEWGVDGMITDDLAAAVQCFPEYF